MKKKNLKSKLRLSVKDLSSLTKAKPVVNGGAAFLTNPCSRVGCCPWSGACTDSCTEFDVNQ